MKERSFELTLVEETSQLRSDRGHLTKWGASVAQLRFALAGADLNDLKKLDAETAKAVYEAEWQEARLDDYPVGLDYFMFDSCLFYGRSIPIGWLSIALIGRDVCYDSRAAVRIAALVADIAEDRVAEVIGLMAFLRRRRDRAADHYKYFGASWNERVARVKEKALSLKAEKTNAKPEQVVVVSDGVQLSFGF